MLLNLIMTSFLVKLLLSYFNDIFTYKKSLKLIQHDNIFENNFTRTLRKLNNLNSTRQFHLFSWYFLPHISLNKFSLKHINISNIELFSHIKSKMFLLYVLFFKCITFLHFTQHLLLLWFSFIVCIYVDLINVFFKLLFLCESWLTVNLWCCLCRKRIGLCLRCTRMRWYLSRSL